MTTSAGRQDGPKIRRLREKHGLTVRELATQIGVHPQSLRKVELNRGPAGIGMLLKIADRLEVELDEIVRRAALSRDSGGDPERAA